MLVLTIKNNLATGWPKVREKVFHFSKNMTNS